MTGQACVKILESCSSLCLAPQGNNVGDDTAAFHIDNKSRSIVMKIGKVGRVANVSKCSKMRNVFQITPPSKWFKMDLRPSDSARKGTKLFLTKQNHNLSCAQLIRSDTGPPLSCYVTVEVHALSLIDHLSPRYSEGQFPQRTTGGNNLPHNQTHARVHTTTHTHAHATTNMHTRTCTQTTTHTRTRNYRHAHTHTHATQTHSHTRIHKRAHRNTQRRSDARADAPTCPPTGLRCYRNFRLVSVAHSF